MTSQRSRTRTHYQNTGTQKAILRPPAPFLKQ